MFRFANPEYIYALAILPLLWLIYLFVAKGRRKRLAKYGNVELVKSFMSDVSNWRPKFKFFLFLVALGVIIIGAARPQLGSKLREEKSQGVEMMFVVDVSNSMLAEDFEPNRLDRTKYAINKLFDGMKQDRAGLIAFAGDAVVQLPITADFRMARAFTDRLSPDLVGVQGTSIGQALDLALLSFSQQNQDAEVPNKSNKVIILITDGENHESDAIKAAEMAKAQGVKIFTIGIGTPEGAPISIDGEFIRDENGDMVVSKLNEQMLEQIATISEGGYIRATKQDIGLNEVINEIARMEKGELTTVHFEEYNELFQYLIALALALLLFEFYLNDRRNHFLHKFNIFKEE